MPWPEQQQVLFPQLLEVFCSVPALALLRGSGDGALDRRQNHARITLRGPSQGAAHFTLGPANQDMLLEPWNLVVPCCGGL